MSITRSFERAALWYAKNEYPVFPLSPGDKRPLNAHGFKEATSDLAQVKRWSSENPNANIGIPTGEPSGWLVLDVDPRNGGNETLARLVEKHGPLPKTAMQSTGGGGVHYLFRHVQGVRCGVIADGLDRKADGGYIVVAPSVTSGSYSWVGGTVQLQGTLRNLAEAPAWVLGSTKPATGATLPKGGRIPEGSRNSTLTSLAGMMRRRGMTECAIASALLEENRQQCDPPLAEAEVRQIAENIAQYRPSEKSARDMRDDDSTNVQNNWPDAMRPEAFHGLAGELIRAIEPHSEADTAALLLQFLVAFGNVIGRRPHFMAEADLHFTNLFAVIVGRTAKGRKGTSWGQIQRVLAAVDGEWSNGRLMSGLASGEGLIWSVRDEIRERSPVREKGQVIRYEEVISDDGETDKRLMVMEPEFARVLQVAERESNTLSAVIRQAWDTGNLRILTKKQAARSTEAHISMIGHITGDELRRRLTDTAAGNGFANRILWVCARRSRLLPEGGALDAVDFTPYINRLKAAVRFAREVGVLRRDDNARAIWRNVYAELSEGKPGLLGAVTSRAEAQVMRLACVYALLDCSTVIQSEHLMAALAVWQYCENSARFIFGDALGDGTADEILRELRNHPQGMARNDIREHFNRNKSAAEIGRALSVLQEYGLARMERGREQEGQTRPTERWFAVSAVRP
jgi:hypothetical protein